MAEGGVEAPAESEAKDVHQQLEDLKKEQQAWIEERERLQEEIETLKGRCQKLARAAAAAAKPEVKEEMTQTEADDGIANGASTGGVLPPLVEEMLLKPQDAEVQLRCVQELFQAQTQVDDTGAQSPSPSALRGSLEAAVAIFGNHPRNRTLCLKASQFLSVLLAEPGSEENLSLALLFKAAQDVVTIGAQLLVDVANGAPSEMAAAQPVPAKLLTWFLSVLALLLPSVSVRLRDRTQGEAFVTDLFSKLAGPLLASADFPQEALILKCAQLLPLMPSEPWIQKACVDSGTVHGLALAYRRCPGVGAGASFAPPGRGIDAAGGAEAPNAKAIRAAVRWVFAQNLELCVKAMEDTFVDDAFICLEGLDELRGVEKKQRGTFVALDADWRVVGKALGLWTHHQRRALEDPEPLKCISREVLCKVADLLGAVLLKLPPKRLIENMQEFTDVRDHLQAEVFRRIALATIDGCAQLRLQVAVNYLDNNAVDVVIGAMRSLLLPYDPEFDSPVGADVEAAFRLLQDAKLPAEGWPYVNHCLDICIHVLSHWSATKASLAHKADVLDKRSAPLVLAQGGLVDVLVQLIDPASTGYEFTSMPPKAVVDKATEALQGLFEQNGHICLFCMQHYSQVRQMVDLGCASLSSDPLAEHPKLQQQAVVVLATAFESFAIQDEKLGRKIRKALAVLFETSYKLVSWFLTENPLSTLTELQSLDVHTEAVRAIAHAPYWSHEDAALLPEFVALIVQLLLDSVEGAGPNDVQKPGKRAIDLTEAEEVVAACIAAVLHLLLIDPSPPTVSECLAKHLAESKGVATEQQKDSDESAQAVNALMHVMQVFPSSDRVQTNCQLLLSSLLE